MTPSIPPASSGLQGSPQSFPQGSPQGALQEALQNAAGPLEGYNALVTSGALTFDAAQAQAAGRLSALHDALMNYAPALASPGSPQGGWLRRWRRRPPPTPRGVYLHGDVGRGKSLLMDLFYETTPFTPKRRVHFHEFMLEVHETIHHWRKMPPQEKRAAGFEGDDPIPPLARKIAGESMLLCFDEFQITDVADAMILGRLFEALMEAGVVIVLTSNREPTELYKGGLNRGLFLPTIAMLKARLDVVHLAALTDYRLERVGGMPVYHTPLGEKTDRELDDSFMALTGAQKGAPAEIAVKQGRRLAVPEALGGVARFSFTELCERPLGPADYLALAANFHTLVLARIPKMGREKRNEAKRFVTLVDALYDNKIKLVCSADALPEALYPAGDGSFEFARTASRLREMQSHEYFEAAEVNHKP